MNKLYNTLKVVGALALAGCGATNSTQTNESNPFMKELSKRPWEQVAEIRSEGFARSGCSTLMDYPKGFECRVDYFNTPGQREKAESECLVQFSNGDAYVGNCLESIGVETEHWAFDENGKAMGILSSREVAHQALRDYNLAWESKGDLNNE
jgi:hypothetical protein